MVCFTYMNLSFAHDLFYLVAAVCLLAVSGFVCWALYEWARLGKQTNELVEESREKLGVLEGAFEALLEQVESITSLVGSVSSVAHGIFGFFQRRDRRGSLREDVRRLQEELDLLEEER